KAIREQTKEDRQAVNQRLRKAERDLDEAIYADDASEAAIEQRARELGEAHAASARLRARTELNIRRVLTPEQLNTLRTLRAEAARRLRERRLRNQDGERRQFRRPLSRTDAENQQGGAKPADTGASPGQRKGEFQRRPRP
ncbi:MAG TPA: hypothetical protein VF507_03820, partial [Pyrinomonadaceae bacterium]